MAIANGYTTLAVLHSYLGIATADTVDDTTLEQAVEAASRAIDNYCGRRFYADGAATARLYRPVSAGWLDVDDISTTTSLAVKTDENDDATFEITWTVATDCQLEPLNGVGPSGEAWPYTRIVAVGVYEFPTANDHAAAQVTAKWGWTTAPEPVQQACLQLSAEMWKRKDAPFGVAGVGDFGVLRVPADGMRQVASLLGPYRKGGFVVGVA